MSGEENQVLAAVEDRLSRLEALHDTTRRELREEFSTSASVLEHRVQDLEHQRISPQSFVGLCNEVGQEKVKLQRFIDDRLTRLERLEQLVALRPDTELARRTSNLEAWRDDARPQISSLVRMIEQLLERVGRLEAGQTPAAVRPLLQEPGPSTAPATPAELALAAEAATLVSVGAQAPGGPAAVRFVTETRGFWTPSEARALANALFAAAREVEQQPRPCSHGCHNINDPDCDYHGCACEGACLECHQLGGGT